MPGLDRMLAVSIGVVCVVWLARRVDLDAADALEIARRRLVGEGRSSSGAETSDVAREAAGSRSAKSIRERVEEALDIVDEAHTGSVSLAELTHLMRLAGANPTEAEGATYRKVLREAGETSVKADTLEAVMEQFESAHPPEAEHEEALQAWIVIDKDGDGVVAGAEIASLVRMVTTLGEPLMDEEAAELVSDLDSDGNGCARAWTLARRHSPLKRACASVPVVCGVCREISYAEFMTLLRHDGEHDTPSADEEGEEDG